LRRIVLPDIRGNRHAGNGALVEEGKRAVFSTLNDSVGLARLRVVHHVCREKLRVQPRRFEKAVGSMEDSSAGTLHPGREALMRGILAELEEMNENGDS
ncbi:MAG: hypothetical protein VB039_10180, partial [Oscillospiraceae bacterium]|nr:hypothetical protein [Oscillospiraceae bacterium]